MATIKIVGEAVVLTSSLKLDDIKLVQKHQPKKLCLYEEDGDGKMVPCFRISTGDGEVKPSDVSEFGITFRKASREGGYAQITCKVPEGDGEAKELVAEAFGAPLMGLIKLEDRLPDVVDDILDLKHEILSSIQEI